MNTILRAKWFYILLCASLVLGLAVAPVSAMPLAGSSAVDGDGLMSISPTSATYGTNVALFTFTFTANNDFGSGSQVDITIPAGWTPPTTAPGAGHISWFSGTCTLSGAPPVAVTGMDIFIDMTSCLTGNSFTITYANSIPGPISGSPYTFLVQTDIGAGGAGLTPITAGSPTVSILPKPLTVSATGLTPASKIYDATTTAVLTIGTPTLVGVVGTDHVTLVTGGVAADFADPNTGTGKLVNISGLTLAGAEMGNYTLTQPTRSANITRRPITVTAGTETRIYNGTSSSGVTPTITTGALQGPDTAAWHQTFNNKNAGSGKILTPSGTVSDGNGGANYTVTFVPVATGVITKKPISVFAEPDTKVYNGSTSSVGIPLITPSLVGSDTSGFTQTFNTKNIGTAKTITASGKVNDGNNGANYSVVFFSDNTGVITAKALTVSAAGLTPASKIYNGSVSASLTIGTPSLVGVVAPDVVNLVTSGAHAAFVDRNAGLGKLVNISGLTISGAGAGNYTLTQPTRTASITKKPLTVTAVTDTKAYDGTTTSSGVPILSGSTPLVPGDIAPVWTQSFNNKNAGSNKVLIPAGLVNDGNGGKNYAYTYATNATGVISRRPITVTAFTDSKAYDGSSSSSVLPALSAGTPLAAGDSEPVWTQTFANKNVGTGKTLTSAGAVIDGNGGLNYTYNFVPDITGVITSRAITVTALTDTRAYNGTTSSSVAPNITPGLVGSDTSGFIQTFDTADLGTNKTLTPSGVVNDGNAGLNYSVTFIPVSTGTINKADPILSVINPTVIYTGTPRIAIVSSGSVPGTVSNIKYNGSTTAPTNAGTYAITADFTSSNLNYNDLIAAPAGKFIIIRERAINGGFNVYAGVSRIPSGWIPSNFAATDGKDTVNRKEGAASVRIAGLLGKLKTLSQTLTLAGSATDVIRFSFWVKANALPAGGVCQVQVLFYNGTVLKSARTINCPVGATYTWRQVKVNMTGPAAYTRVIIKYSVSKSGGTVWFDGVSLMR